MLQTRRKSSNTDELDLAQVHFNENNKSSRLTRIDWLVAARDALITEGKDALKIERLAKKLDVTRGGFYWHFRGRDDLLDALLISWEEETNVLFEQALQGDQRPHRPPSRSRMPRFVRANSTSSSSSCAS